MACGVWSLWSLCVWIEGGPHRQHGGAEKHREYQRAREVGLGDEGRLCLLHGVEHRERLLLDLVKVDTKLWQRKKRKERKE